MPNIRSHETTGNPAGRERGSTCQRIPCPDCGEPFGNLPNHLPCDGGADAQ